MADLDELRDKAGEKLDAAATKYGDPAAAKVGKYIKWIALGIVVFGLVIGYFIKG